LRAVGIGEAFETASRGIRATSGAGAIGEEEEAHLALEAADGGVGAHLAPRVERGAEHAGVVGLQLVEHTALQAIRSSGTCLAAHHRCSALTATGAIEIEAKDTTEAC
jgi:hypothetical protein